MRGSPPSVSASGMRAGSFSGHRTEKARRNIGQARHRAGADAGRKGPLSPRGTSDNKYYVVLREGRFRSEVLANSGRPRRKHQMNYEGIRPERRSTREFGLIEPPPADMACIGVASHKFSVSNLKTCGCGLSSCLSRLGLRRGAPLTAPRASEIWSRSPDRPPRSALRNPGRSTCAWPHDPYRSP